MGKYVFKKDTKGIRKFLQSDDMKNYIEGVANRRHAGEHINVFVGTDRAKAIIGGRNK